MLRHYRLAWLRGDVVALLIALRRWIPAAPGPLVAVVGSTVVVALFDLQSAGVAVVGEIPAGLPRPSLPDFGAIDLAALIGAALGITVVGYTDNVLTARAFAVRGEDRIDPQQEFLALGAANLSAGVLQGFPVSSSGSRTAVGDTAGSRTQLHSLVALAVVLLTLLALRPVLSDRCRGLPGVVSGPASRRRSVESSMGSRGRSARPPPALVRTDPGRDLSSGGQCKDDSHARHT